MSRLSGGYSAEGNGVLVIDRRAGQAPVDRAPSKDDRECTQLDWVLRCTYDDELTAARDRWVSQHISATEGGTEECPRVQPGRRPVTSSVKIC